MFLLHKLLPNLLTKNHHKHFVALFHSSNLWFKLVQYNLSDIGEGIADVQVKEWHVKEGDVVAEFDELCSVQSDKASVTITSRFNGTIKKLYYKPDDIAKVGRPLVDIEIPEHCEGKETAKVLSNATIAITSESLPLSPKILASPAVRRLIRTHGINTADVTGSGKDGRLLKEDILKLTPQILAAEGSLASVLTHDIKKSEDVDIYDGSSSDSDDEMVPIRGYTRAMVRTMTEALKIPHFGYSDEIVADRLIEVKTLLVSVAAAQQDGGVSKIGLVPIFVKAASMALRQFPRLNASLDPSHGKLILKRTHNISLAIDTPDGLAVPNIKNCQRKSILEIASDFGELLSRAREGRLSQQDLAGGTFTLSNIGSIGGTYMSPLIMPPQLVIGAIGSIRKVPRFDGQDKLVARHVLIVSWSADHRVVDGATMARFSNCFKHFLEQPEAMLAKLR